MKTAGAGARNREGNPAVFGAGASVTSILGEFTSSLAPAPALEFLPDLASSMRNSGIALAIVYVSQSTHRCIPHNQPLYSVEMQCSLRSVKYTYYDIVRARKSVERFTCAAPPAFRRLCSLAQHVIKPHVESRGALSEPWKQMKPLAENGQTCGNSCFAARCPPTRSVGPARTQAAPQEARPDREEAERGDRRIHDERIAVRDECHPTSSILAAVTNRHSPLCGLPDGLCSSPSWRRDERECAAGIGALAAQECCPHTRAGQEGLSLRCAQPVADRRPMVACACRTASGDSAHRMPKALSPPQHRWPTSFRRPPPICGVNATVGY